MKTSSEISKILKGKTISHVRQMTDEEARRMGCWYKKPIIIQFTDGTILIPQSEYNHIFYGHNPISICLQNHNKIHHDEPMTQNAFQILQSMIFYQYH